MSERKLLKMALEALENCASERGHRCNRCDSEVDEGGRVITALRAALDEATVKDCLPVRHTPGPWMIRAERHRFIHVYAHGGGIAHLDTVDGEGMANARLIAAAPELHAENERQHAEIERLRAERNELLTALAQISVLHTGGLGDIARAAIAKAGGNDE